MTKIKTDDKCPECEKKGLNIKLTVVNWSPMGIDKWCAECGFKNGQKFNGTTEPTKTGEKK